MENLEQARKILTAEGCTCVLCKADQVHKSTRRGVQPLLELLDSGIVVQGFSAADKVVGKATAFLYCLLGVKAVYGQVMSRSAAAVLVSHGIQALWGTQVEAIMNRSQDGFCPMETATRHTDDPEEALRLIREALKRLQRDSK